jgi:hypothetical protein
MATGLSLELRQIKPQPEIIAGTECHPTFRKINGKSIPWGVSRCMPFIGASRDRTLPGKARIRARKAANRGA